jgi:hypothetical protein
MNTSETEKVILTSRNTSHHIKEQESDGRDEGHNLAERKLVRVCARMCVCIRECMYARSVCVHFILFLIVHYMIKSMWTPYSWHYALGQVALASTKPKFVRRTASWQSMIHHSRESVSTAPE